MQHRANRNVRGRHRRTTPLHSHRAPSTPVTEKGRYAVAAALVAGVGVAGLTTATDGASSSPATAKTRQAAAQATLAPSASAPAPTPTLSPSPTATPTPVASSLSATAAGIQVVDEGVPFVPQARKEKPLPLWVNPLPEGATTSCFGPRWGRLHAGVDLAAPDGTPIRAAGAGVVVAAGPAEGYGNAVLIDHGNGYLTHYGHMSVITTTVGQQVAAGDQIGNEGSTGHSTGPHLHFEVHQGSYKNPIEPTAWMHEHGVDITGCAAPATQP
ncbi:peptidoglycan DD-metalloendopeptidase family protein [Actinoplanes sp. NPDC048967]|uniref:M23 family metallopeptidase n=1 Tax=Actinoplanes sp. NPDC048967 TaxID=3155269 RepID=UPI0033F682AE